MENKKRTQILLINDMAGYGKVALSAMIPVLSHLKYETFNLPTALVSNTLDYGQFDILETTDYMNHTLQIWKNLMFSFDAICTGFIVSETQSSLVYEYCKEQQKTGTMIFVDPIMGDNGKRYNGVTDDAVTYMKQLCSIADVIVPIKLCVLSQLHNSLSKYAISALTPVIEGHSVFIIHADNQFHVLPSCNNCVLSFDDIEDAVPLPGQHLQRFILILQTESDNSIVVNLFCEFDKPIRGECFAMFQ